VFPADKSTFLIDCGDGSLQQILRGSPFRLGSIERIFITHMHGDHVHGLAALLMFLGLRNRGAASQGKDKAKQSKVEMKPIHIYGPLGLRHFLRVLLSATHSGIEIGYAVHELLPRDERVSCLGVLVVLVCFSSLLVCTFSSSWTLGQGTMRP
jgi:ribonuclease Z